MLDAARSALAGRDLRVITTDGELIAVRGGTGRAAAVRGRQLDCDRVADRALVARRDPARLRRHDHRRDPDFWWRGGRGGRTDVERLLSGELVYTGALRTNVAAIVSHVPIGGRPCPVSSELFAISADAHLLRGSLTPEECTCTFPDGRGASLPEARARLARVVCADPEQLGDGDIEAIVAAVEEAQIAAIAGALTVSRRRCRPGSA